MPVWHWVKSRKRVRTSRVFPAFVRVMEQGNRVFPCSPSPLPGRLLPPIPTSCHNKAPCRSKSHPAELTLRKLPSTLQLTHSTPIGLEVRFPALILITYITSGSLKLTCSSHLQRSHTSYLILLKVWLWHVPHTERTLCTSASRHRHQGYNHGFKTSHGTPDTFPDYSSFKNCGAVMLGIVTVNSQIAHHHSGIYSPEFWIMQEISPCHTG